MTLASKYPWTALVGALAVSCGGSESGPPATGSPAASPPSFQQSPIVFGSYEPPGTFLLTLADPEPRQINDNYDYYPLLLSPSRQRLLQVTPNEDGSLPRGLVQIFEIAPEGARLGSFPTPEGEFLGFADEETLLLMSSDGLQRLDLNGAVQGGFALPAWVSRENGAFYRSAVSPDGTKIALTPTRESELGFETILLVVNSATGVVLDQWPLLGRGVPAWAGDGHVVVAMYAQGLYTFVLGEGSATGPFELPFQPCEAHVWVEPGRVLVGEVVSHGDYSTCDPAWLVSRDGARAEPLPGPVPLAFSPDGERILSIDQGALVVSKPDGSELEMLSDVLEPHDPAW